MIYIRHPRDLHDPENLRDLRRLRHLRLRDTPERRLRRHLVWGGFWIAFGIVVLLQCQGLIDRRELWLALPALFAWSGLVRIAIERTASAWLRAGVRFAIAAYLFVVIEHVGGWTLRATWPVLLIAVGVSIVARALFPRSLADGRSVQEPMW